MKRTTKLVINIFALTLVVFSLMQHGPHTRAALAAHGETISGGKELKLVSEYKKNTLLDISADGRLLLFYQTSRPMSTFHIPLGSGKAKADQPETFDRLLRVVERETGREVGHIGTPTPPRGTTFVPVTQQVFYSEYEPRPQSRTVYKLWNFASGVARACFDHPREVGLGPPHFLDQNHALLTVRHTDPNGEFRGTSFGKISLPDCTLELGTIAADDLKNFPIGGLIALSPDRHYFAYTLRVSPDEVLVREAATLKVIKRIEFPPGIYFGSPMYTPDGKRLMVPASNTMIDNPETKRYLFFYDTTSYNLVKQLDITRSFTPSVMSDSPTQDSTLVGNKMAISPDGRLLAVAHEERREMRKLLFYETLDQAFITLYDLENGEKLGSASYPQIKYNWENPFAAQIDFLAFTPDGKYLLSSTYDTRVWQIEDRNNS